MVSRDISAAAECLVLQGELFTFQLTAIQLAKLPRVGAFNESCNTEKVQQWRSR